MFKTEKLSKTESSYKGIAKHAYIRLKQEAYFDYDSKPDGLAAGGYFYTATNDGTFEVVPLSPDHHVTFELPLQPAAGDLSMWLAFLRSAFEGVDCEAQIQLLREAMGVTLIRGMPATHRAVLLYGVMRSGKRTLLRFLEKLYPREVRCAVHPTQWDDCYSLAQLAGADLNIVGEGAAGTLFPAAVFNTVISMDAVTARPIFCPPFTMRNSAAHWFASEHLPRTGSREMGFFERWIVLRFTRTRAPEDRIENYEQELYDSEGSAIVWWALEGAANFLKRGAKWQLTGSHAATVNGMWIDSDNRVAFLNDPEAVSLGEGQEVVCSTLFKVYQEWCVSYERKARGKQHFYQMVRACHGVTEHRDTQRKFKGIGLGLAPGALEGFGIGEVFGQVTPT